MRRLRYLFAILLIPCLLVVAMPAASYADGPAPGSDALFNKVDCSGTAASSTICQSNGNTNDPVTGASGLIVRIVNLISVFAGIAAVIIIILASLRFVTSGGSSEDVVGARRALIYTVVGLVVLVLARTLVLFILGRI